MFDDASCLFHFGLSLVLCFQMDATNLRRSTRQRTSKNLGDDYTDSTGTDEDEDLMVMLIDK